MKTKLRNISVNNKDYVYWYSGGLVFDLFFSPKGNKNIKINLNFKPFPPATEPYTFWAFYKISSIYNSAEIIIELASPRFIASFISYILMNREVLFVKGKPQVLNGMELLGEMGYSDLRPIWVKDF